MERRHGAGRDPALETVAHDEVSSGAEVIDEWQQCREVVAVVSVSHDDIPAPGRRDPAEQGIAITLLRDGDHAGPRVGR